MGGGYSLTVTRGLYEAPDHVDAFFVTVVFAEAAAPVEADGVVPIEICLNQDLPVASVTAYLHQVFYQRTPDP